MINSVELTAAVKGIITKAQLIDTGLLLNTVQVNYSVSGTTIAIVIVAQEYFKYHLEEINFEKSFTSSPAFDQLVGRVYSPIIERAVQQSVDTGVDFQFNPHITVDFQWL